MASRATRGSVAPIQLGAVRVHTPLILAPMAGVTDAPFRKLCREFGERPLAEYKPDLLSSARVGVDALAGLYVAEMVTARALLEGDSKAWAMVEPDPNERVRSVQLYGTQAEDLGQAAALLAERDLVDHVDLNFGCPVPKVTRKGGGAAIPWKKDLFDDIVRLVVENVDRNAKEGAGSIPVTVKMRIGIDEQHITVFDAAKIAQNRGASAVGLHSRTQEQYYSGAARWSWIARLKERVSIPVFGNGDVFTGADAVRMMEETGCDAVVVGRGAQGRPWLFEDIVSALWGLPSPEQTTLAQVRDVLLKHTRGTISVEGSEFRAMREMRKHVGWYLKGFPLGGETRRQLNLVSSYRELEERLECLDGDAVLPYENAGKGVRAGKPRKPHLPHGWLDSQSLSATEREGLDESDDGGSGG